MKLKSTFLGMSFLYCLSLVSTMEDSLAVSYEPNLDVKSMTVAEVDRGYETQITVDAELIPLHYLPSAAVKLQSCRVEFSWLKFTSEFNSNRFDSCVLRESKDGVLKVTFSETFPAPYVARTYQVERIFLTLLDQGEVVELNNVVLENSIEFRVEGNEEPQPLIIDRVEIVDGIKEIGRGQPP